jgi:glutamate/tyrosine decarboxylase-like PLP-dependent enzyme
MTQSPDALESALHHARSFLANLDDRPVHATASLAELRARLGRKLATEGVAEAEVIDDLVRDASPGIVGSAGGRFFAWVIGGGLPAAVAADWLAAVWDQNAAQYACGPAASVVEEVAGAWLKDLLNIPDEASFAFVSGCQNAHFTGLAAARHALLEREGWPVEDDGLFGAPAIRILASECAHGSLTRAVTQLGLGRKNIVPLATDEQGRIRPESLSEALRETGPCILALQAGDIATGAFDDFATLVPMAKANGAWVHIDGAFGLWAAASPAKRNLMRGAELADSWATDGHKWLNVPYDSGYAFVRDARAHRAALSYRASYLTHDAVARDQMDWNPEWSRRARGFSTYAALRQLGREGVAELIDRCCAHAAAIVEGLRDRSGIEIVSAPIINQALVRFVSAGASEAENDARTDAIVAAINAGGEAFFSGATWRGRRVMRISICNWRTNDSDVQRAIAAIRKASA